MARHRQDRGAKTRHVGCGADAGPAALAAGQPLEALKGDRAGQFSIRANDRWRLCFVWTEAGPDRVELVDYH
jgi:proteic killer suppression protein